MRERLFFSRKIERMSVRRSRRILLAALAISLLIHLILAGYIRWPDFRRHAQRPQPISVTAMTLARRTPPPPALPHTPQPLTPPPQTPPPQTPPPVRAARTAAPAPPQLRHSRRPGRRQRGAGTAGPGTAPTAAPPALPTPVPASALPCRAPNAPAAIASAPPAPPLEEAQREANTQGVAAVQVTVTAAGTVQQTALVSSSGSTVLDAEALALAHEAAYAPAYAECRAVAGTVIFRVGFAPMSVETAAPAAVP